MYRTLRMFSIGLLGFGLFGGQVARADLASQFAGYTSVNEVAQSGLTSSYYASTQQPNGLCPTSMPTLGAQVSDSVLIGSAYHVNYPYGVGAVPSPGAYDPGETPFYDEGMLGIKKVGGNLVVQLATAISPTAGHYDGPWNTWYGQGDMFITVADSQGVRQYALLNDWARGVSGNPLSLGGGYYANAQSFHTQGGANGDSLEGHLVQLNSSSDVAAVGGAGSYNPTYTPAPAGLDYRAFAQGGSNVGNANLSVSSLSDYGYDYYAGYNDNPQAWYVETWTLPTSWLTTDSSFDLALHSSPSCGNDQIGMMFDVRTPPQTVPAPAALVLGMIGLGAVGWMKRQTR